MGAICVCVSAECVDLCGRLCVCTYLVYRCACAGWEHSFAASQPVGRRGMDLHQPHLCQAVGFGNL